MGMAFDFGGGGALYEATCWPRKAKPAQEPATEKLLRMLAQFACVAHALAHALP